MRLLWAKSAAQDQQMQNPKLTDNSATPWNPRGPTYYDSATDSGGMIFGTAASMDTVVPGGPAHFRGSAA
jgi:hypothetical protein